MPTNIHNRQFTEKDWEVKSKQILTKLSESKQIVGQSSWGFEALGQCNGGESDNAALLHA